MRLVLLLFCVLGTVLPFSQFLPWVARHGFAPGRFVSDLFANEISGFFAMDVIVSALTLIAFVVDEGRRLRMGKLWIPIAATVSVGVSLGLPLFLYLRETAIRSRLRLPRDPHAAP